MMDQAIAERERLRDWLPPHMADGKPMAFTNCTAARAAGAAPIRVGEPGYRAGLSRHRDGVA